MLLDPTHRFGHPCGPNPERCGLIHFQRPLERSTPLWSTDQEGRLYGMVAPSALDRSDGILFRVDAPDFQGRLNVEDCNGDICTIISDSSQQ